VPLVRRLITCSALYSRSHISNYHPVQCVGVERNYRRGLNLNRGFVNLCVKTHVMRVRLLPSLVHFEGEKKVSRHAKAVYTQTCNFLWRNSGLGKVKVKFSEG